VIALDSTGDIKKALDTPSTYLIVHSAGQVPTGWNVTPVQTFASYASMQQTIASGSLIPGVKAVMYDNESWSSTPTVEKQNPAKYEQLVSQFAHAHGLQYVAAPGADLAGYLNAGSGISQTDSFLKLDMASDAARYADVLDIQAQSIQNNEQSYAAFVDAAAAQARAANPNIKIVSGLSTNPHGLTSSATQMVSDAQAVSSQVQGFWLNDPGRGSSCPTCTGPYPSMAAEVVESLG
jgi:hypothetical protein